MLVVADRNIVFVKEAFQALGEVRLMRGREMTPAAVRDATLLLVRSITPVNRALLEGSAVRFVATATVGRDHVDAEYLRDAGVAFAAAPGSNANSVAEYITAALLVLALRQGKPLEGRTIGIVGAGNVGSRVAAKVRALGMRELLNDPPLQRATGEAKYRPHEELMDCDFITLHVPLEKGGPDPTWHMVGADFLARMRPEAALLNSSRGAVVDNGALLEALRAGRPGAAALDVWEGEPRIRPALLAKAALATPHVAGYSFDGKVAGTEMIYRAACAFLGRKPDWSPARCMPPPLIPEIELQPRPAEPEESLREAVLRVCPIERDDAALRKLAGLPPAEQGPYFDRLRAEYPVRREFQNTTIRLRPAVCAGFTAGQAGADSAASVLGGKLKGIGFNV
jgi:erythronate-4-phosphate dehydrogenase